MAALSKAAYIEVFCSLAGGNNVARVIDARDGWPGLVEINVGGTFRQFSLHVGVIGSMHRKQYEYRFQNPAKSHPVQTLPGTTPLLIGIWDIDQPNVFVAAEPDIRLGDNTRFSVLFPERLFRAAQEVGWAEPYINKKKGVHWAFLPQLLPSFIEHTIAEVPLAPKDVQIAVVGAGLIGHPQEAAAAARARAATTRLIRDARFAKTVVSAYGNRCAMCGLNLGLVAGAHIVPASVLGSSDQPTNGLALCENHHRAFDRHGIWVDPDSRVLKIHPRMWESAKKHDQDKVFVTTTFKQVAEPLQKVHLPNREVFVDRYAYFKGQYDWV